MSTAERRTSDGFLVTYDENGAHVALPTKCEFCGNDVTGTYDTHMVMSHPEKRLKPVVQQKEPKKKRKK